MDSPTLRPEYTVSHIDYGMSARAPTKVWSLAYNQAEYRVFHAGTPVHPGWQWGVSLQHLTREWDRVAVHDHDYCEVTLVRGGTALHRTVNGSAPLTARSVVVASPGQIHALDDLDGLQETHLAFLPEWLSDDLRACWSEPDLVPLFLSAPLFRRPLLREVAVFSLQKEEYDELDADLGCITREIVRERPSLVYLKVCVLKCLITLARAYARQRPDGAPLTWRREVWAVMEHIENKLTQGETIAVHEMAEQIGLSHRRLDTIFREATGTSPMEYFQNRRTQWAARLLLDPAQSISEVAHRLGYSDAAHLSNTFKRCFGMSPSEYRRLYDSAPFRGREA